MGIRNAEAKNNANNGNNNRLSTSIDNGEMGFGVLRKGRYYDHPDLYVKTIPTNGWGEGIDAEDATLSRIEQESSKTYEEITKIELPKAETPIEIAKNKQTERTLFRFDKDFASMIALQNAIRNTELYKYNQKGKLEELNKGLFDSMAGLLQLLKDLILYLKNLHLKKMQKDKANMYSQKHSLIMRAIKSFTMLRYQ